MTSTPPDEALVERVANRIFSSGELRERQGGDAALWDASLRLSRFICELPAIAALTAAQPVSLGERDDLRDIVQYWLAGHGCVSTDKSIDELLDELALSLSPPT